MSGIHRRAGRRGTRRRCLGSWATVSALIVQNCNTVPINIQCQRRSVPYHPRTSGLRLSNSNSSSSWLTIGPQARGPLLSDNGPSSCRIQYSSSYLTSTSTVFSPQTWTLLPIQQFREENIFITARLNRYRCRISVYDLRRARFEQPLCVRVDADVDRRSLDLEETQRRTERFAVELNIQCWIIDATCHRHRAFASTFAA